MSYFNLRIAGFDNGFTTTILRFISPFLSKFDLYELEIP